MGTYTDHVHVLRSDAPADAPNRRRDSLIPKPEAKPKVPDEDEGGADWSRGPGTTVETKVVYLDVDGDGVIDYKQTITVTKKYIDIDGDGEVDSVQTTTATKLESV